MAPDIMSQLQDDASQLTFFAPENVAFLRLSPEERALFEMDVSGNLKYHLLTRMVAQKDMRDGSQEATEEGQSVFITVQGAQRDIWINDAYIVDGDQLAINGDFQLLCTARCCRAPFSCITLRAFYDCLTY